MSIDIQRDGDRYRAAATPPDSRTTWASSEPMKRDDLVDVLRGLGCHTTDIADAFYAADPDWLATER